MLKPFKILMVLFLFCVKLQAQQFNTLPDEMLSGPNALRFGDMILTTRGSILFAGSGGLSEVDGTHIELTSISSGPLNNKDGSRMYLGKNSNIFKDVYESFVGIKLLCEGPDNIIYVVSNNNHLGIINYNESKAIGFPPFNFPETGGQQKIITEIWLDKNGELFIATNTDTIYTVVDAAKICPLNTADKQFFFMPGLDKDSNYVVLQGAKPVKNFTLGKGIIAYSFCESPDNKRIVLIGTNKGLYGYDKVSGQAISYLENLKTPDITVTGIEPDKSGLTIWLSTLEKGMVSFNTITKSMSVYEYPKKNAAPSASYPVTTFSRKSDDEFFVAIADSLPAVFNKKTGSYVFINDSVFSKTANKTTDIKADAFGNLFVSKGGGFYWSKTYLTSNSRLFAADSSLYGPYITDITINGKSYNTLREFYGRYESLKEADLKYFENQVSIFYSCRGIEEDSLIFRWKLDNYSDDWKIIPYSVFGDEMNMILFDNLKPGHYLLHISAKSRNSEWLSREAQLVLVIAPPLWQTWWFWLSVIAGITLLVLVFAGWRESVVRKQERTKSAHEKDMLELEAKALRAQMNPHFIFNCMNSIKSLIQKKEEEKAINYLTTFSKLIRTIFQNSDKREISLFDEMETCRLYAQLESMRFDKKFSYLFDIDENIDLKSLMVPALIIQPFIENAIWHGIMPKEEGGYVHVKVKREKESICCIVDDNGIGREMSRQNKFKGEPSSHQSRGVHLTQSRLDLDNTLNQRNAAVAIVDKSDDEGRPAGTTVILTFKEY